MSDPARFTAMGCEVAVGGATAASLREVRALFESAAARFSRFRAGSELCRVNAAVTEVVAVSAPFAHAVQTALDAAAVTGGLVDPTLLTALEHAGYDADFTALDRDADRPPGPPVRSALADVRLTGRLLVRPPGVRLDLNGVVKGLTADAALALLGGPGWVSAGGDVVCSRPLEVALPGGGSVRLTEGALATSSPSVRRWRRGGREQHHLIDPRTGCPAEARWTAVTACAATCAGADIAAKAAFLLGDDGPDWLEAHALPGRLVAGDGTVVTTAGWAAAAAEVAACT